MRWFLSLLFVIAVASGAVAQTKSVDPNDLSLSVTIEELPATPFRQEMILLTIHGIYKRHITREKLEQPDLAGFNWMQLGQDHWFESMLDGRPVKNMRRRMAVFPDETGLLEIGPFQHHLTLLDEENKWFEHTISSAPVSLSVVQEPEGVDWWFPVRRVQVADNWSNAPDQLAKGAGVLRVVRISALGASPDMIPPMPELTSPSALIFAHPEKRLVDLTPRGPEAIAYWRWTITPTNGHSAILEPFRFSYFDTIAREMREVEISAQRVAFGEVVPTNVEGRAASRAPVPVALHSGLLVVVGGLVFFAGCGLILRGRSPSLHPVRQWITRKRLLWQLGRATRSGNSAMVRQVAHQLDQSLTVNTGRTQLLHQLDCDLFSASDQTADLRRFTRYFRRSLI